MTQTDALAQFDDAVYKYAHQWYRYPSIRADFDLEDLAQIGRIYILKALEDYDPDAGMTLSTYIIQRIRWGLNTSLRSSMPRAKRETVHFSIDQMNSEQSDRWHPHTEEDDTDTFSEMIAGLSPARRWIMEMRFVDDLTLAQIGEKVHRSHEWVRQIINNTLNTLEL